MKLVHVALLYLGTVTFLGVDAARVDVATEFKRKWTKWALSRSKRDVKPAGVLRGLGAAADVLPLIRTQDMKEDSRVSPASNRGDAHIRVKRQRQSMNRFPHFQTKACRFGTCTVHWLVDELHRAAVNDRNDAAPPNKISPQGYGRRRRSLPERRSPALSPHSGRRPRRRQAQSLGPVLGV
ncbi:pro-adrenomedullin [Prinia subflava]|uniref:pro-adrenomedullin n=1 Tax=Prinia subflava TaxID=208062 RepID=UPI002FE1C808